VAARLKADLALDAEILEGKVGEFSVWIDDRKVAERRNGEFPSDDEIVRVVRAGT